MQLKVDTSQRRQTQVAEPTAVDLGDARQGGRSVASDDARRAAAARIAGRSLFAARPEDLLNPGMVVVAPVATLAHSARESEQERRADSAMRGVERDLPDKVRKRVENSIGREVDGSVANVTASSSPGRLQGEVAEMAIDAVRREMPPSVDGADRRRIEAEVARRAQGVGRTEEARVEREREKRIEERQGKADAGPDGEAHQNPNSHPVAASTRTSVIAPNSVQDRAPLKGRIGSQPVSEAQQESEQVAAPEAIPVTNSERATLRTPLGQRIGADTSIAAQLGARAQPPVPEQAPVPHPHERTPEREMSRARVLDPQEVAKRLQEQAAAGSRIALATSGRAMGNAGAQHTFENHPPKYLEQAKVLRGSAEREPRLRNQAA